MKGDTGAGNKSLVSLFWSPLPGFKRVFPYTPGCTRGYFPVSPLPGLPKAPARMDFIISSRHG